MDKLYITILVLLLIVGWLSYLLYKKDSIHNEIDRMRQIVKRNEGSNVNNDITPIIQNKQRKKRLKRIFTKKKKNV